MYHKWHQYRKARRGFRDPAIHDTGGGAAIMDVYENSLAYEKVPVKKGKKVVDKLMYLS
jgi:hypothetical protein